MLKRLGIERHRFGPKWRAWRALASMLVSSLALSAVVSCDWKNFQLGDCRNCGLPTFPSNFSLEGTTWVGPFNDSSGRGDGTLAIVFDRARDRGFLFGNWVTTFPDAARNISGPVEVYPKVSNSPADALIVEMRTPHFNMPSSPGPGCSMVLSATVSGGEMAGTINTGVNTCDPAETKRSIRVTLSQQ